MRCYNCGFDNRAGAKFCRRCGAVVMLHQRYQVVRLLKKGGMGTVYLAHDTRLGNTPVAIKENLDHSPEAQARFRTEAVLLSRLRHPNLPRVTDHFVLAGRGQYLVMDFIAGESLQDKLDAHAGPLPEGEVLFWIEQVCNALAYLHAQNPPIIHRDVKPANIIVTPEGQAMLVDLGISKVWRAGSLTTDAIRGRGTPGYAPLEQYVGGTDPRTDIYALGATLYTLLTGQEPPESIALSGGVAALAPPRQRNPVLSVHVEQAILKAMALRREDRFPSVAEMKTVLRLPTRSGRAAPPQITPANAARVGQLRILGKGQFHAAARSPDGHWLAVASSIGIWLYHAATLDEQSLLESKHAMNGVTFSPDSRSLAAASQDGAVEIWDVAARRLKHELRGHTRAVTALAFSQSGRQLASGDEEGAVWLWDTASGQGQTAAIRLKFVRSLNFTADGRFIAAAGGNTVAVWNLMDASEQSRLVFGETRPTRYDDAYRAYIDGQEVKCSVSNISLKHGDTVNTIVVGPTTHILASGGEDRTVYLWDVQAMRLLFTLTAHPDAISCLAFSHDGQILASGGKEGAICLWRVRDGRLLQTLEGHTGAINQLTFNTADRLLASASDDGTVRVWAVTTGQAVRQFTGHQPVTNVAFDAQDWLLASQESDDVVLWDLRTGHEFVSLRDTHPEIHDAIHSRQTAAVSCIAISPDGLTLATGDDAGLVRLWNMTNGQLKDARKGSLSPIWDLAFSPNGRILVYTDFMLVSLALSDMSSRRITSATGPFATGITFSPDGRYLCVADPTKVGVLRSASWQMLWRVVLWEPDDAIMIWQVDVAWSPDGHLIAVPTKPGYDKAEYKLVLLDSATGRQVHALPVEAESVAFSPDGQLLASGHQSGAVRLWSMPDGHPLTILQGHTSRVNQVVFSPDGRVLASGSADGTVRLWSMPDGHLLAILQGHTSRVDQVVFSPDGRVLASGSADGTVRLWGVK